MELFLLWVGFAIIIGVAANTRGRSGGGWFLLAVIISPLLAGLLVLALPRLNPELKIQPEANTKACPFCAERIQSAAIVCRYCGRDLNTKKDAAKSSPNTTNLAAPSSAAGAIVAGDGNYRFEVVGESHYQAELEQIVGGRSEEGARCECIGILVPEPDNPYDPNAVYIRIDGRKVAYLARERAGAFRFALAAGGYSLAACRALIVGGWDRGANDRGHFGVKLDAVLPFDLRPAPAAKATAAPQRIKPSSAEPMYSAKMRFAIVGGAIAFLMVVLWAAAGTKSSSPPITLVSTSTEPVSKSSEITSAIPVHIPLPRRRPPLSLH